jgi:hypothetical protein
VSGLGICTKRRETVQGFSINQRGRPAGRKEPPAGAKLPANRRKDRPPRERRRPIVSVRKIRTRMAFVDIFLLANLAQFRNDSSWTSEYHCAFALG